MIKLLSYRMVFHKFLPVFSEPLFMNFLIGLKYRRFQLVFAYFLPFQNSPSLMHQMNASSSESLPPPPAYLLDTTPANSLCE
jgi:hypothetical protein